MTFPRTPTPEDAEALRYAGFFGHRYAVTTKGQSGNRIISVHTDDLRHWSEFMPGKPYPPEREPRAFELIRFKSRSGGRWRRVR